MGSEKGILLAKTIHLKHCGRTRTGKKASPLRSKRMDSK